MRAGASEVGGGAPPESSCISCCDNVSNDQNATGWSKTYLVLAIDSIASANSAGSWTTCRTAWSTWSWWAIAPIRATLSVRTISCHVASVSADTTNNVGSEVTLLWAVVLPVADLTTVLAGLVLIVAESTVKSSKLTQLVTLELILPFWNGRSLEGISSCVSLSAKCGNLRSQ